MDAVPNANEPISLEKAVWIEEQVNRNLDFRVESSEILRKESHATLGWLFGIIVGASGFIVSHTTEDQIWLIVPLGFTVCAAGVEAFVLIKGALLSKDFPSPGNFPSNIATPENLSKSEAEMRLSEARGVEEAALRLESINEKTASAINRARISVATIPTATAIVVLLSYILFD